MKIKRRKGFIGLLALSITGLWAISLGMASDEKATGIAEKIPYNILLMLTDQERYFKEWPKTIGLVAHDRLKDEGIMFQNHYIAATVCTPSRAVLYTGQHVPNNKMFTNSNLPWQPDLSPDIPTIGDMLRHAGYYTAYKGKVHLSKALESHEGEKGEFKTDAMEPYGFSDYNVQGDTYGHQLGGFHNDHVFLADAVRWLRTKGLELGEKKQPWLLAVNLVNPHDIMYFNADPPGESFQSDGGHLMPIRRAPDTPVYRRQHNVPLPESVNEPIQARGRVKAHYEWWKIKNIVTGPVAPKNWKRYQDYYFNCLKDVDLQVERLLDELDDLGLTKQTIIIYTADHGEMGGAHGIREKGPFAYEQAIHVPFIIVHPDYRGGSKCRAITSHVDLAPTLVGLTGIPQSAREAIIKGLPGKDFSGLLKQPEKAELDAIREGAIFTCSMPIYADSGFFERIADYLRKGGDPKRFKESGIRPDLSKRGFVRTVFDGRYKYSRYFSPREHNLPNTLQEILRYNDIELFDLKADPNELLNLGAEPEKHRELILRMNAILNDLIRREIGEDNGQYLPGEGPWAVRYMHY